jgi:hypothetical protein
MKTPRELQLALSHLLDRVKFANKWSDTTFTNSAKASGLTKSEAYRFYKALVEMKLLVFDKHRRITVACFDVQIWRNEDMKMMLVKDIMEMYPDIQQQRGRVKGKHYPTKTIVVAEPEVEEEICEPVNLLANFTPQELADELRSRGFVVTATREVVKTEEL